MGQINPTPPNVQVDPRQIFSMTVAIWITGILWFLLFSSILLSRFTSFYSGISIVLGIGVLAILIFLHGKHVLELSFQGARPPAFDFWRAVYTHFLFGMGRFNLEIPPTRLSQLSPWFMGSVPFVLLLDWWLWYPTREITWIIRLSFLIAILVYGINFSLLRPSNRNSEEFRDIIQTFAALASLILASLPYLGIGPGSTPSPIPPTTPAPITQLTELTFTPTGTPTPTATLTPSFTETVTVTSRATPTARVTFTSVETPILSLVVNAPYLDSLRAGPHQRHPFPFPSCLGGKEATDKKVIIVSRDSSSTWFLVRMVQVERCEGWLQKVQLELGDMNLSDIPIAAITPTNPPPVLPTAEPRDRPTCVPLNPNC